MNGNPVRKGSQGDGDAVSLAASPHRKLGVQAYGKSSYKFLAPQAPS